ncbi:MAG: hypothetical protein JOZ47_04690 [Kutzneria sp.]|nr:hypothetical protein [Kutzneria sp.]
MDVTPYMDSLGRELAVFIEVADGEQGALVERVSGALESAIRLTLLDVLSAAADEITRELAPGAVQLRLRGHTPHFAVRPPPAAPLDDALQRGLSQDGAIVAHGSGLLRTEDGSTVRINVRLPERLKAAVEAAAGKEGRSANAWLVRTVAAALWHPDRDQCTEPRGRKGPQHYTGWVS